VSKLVQTQAGSTLTFLLIEANLAGSVVVQGTVEGSILSDVESQFL